MTTNKPISVLREALKVTYGALVDAGMTTANDYSCQMGIAADALAATEQAAIQPAGEDGSYPYDALFQAIGDSLDSTVKIAGDVFSISVKAFVESIRAKGFDIIAAPAAQQAKAEQGEHGTPYKFHCDDCDGHPAWSDPTATPASKPEVSELPPLPVHDGLTLTMPNRHNVCELLCYGAMDPTKKTSLYTDDAMRAYGQLCRDTASGTRAASDIKAACYRVDWSSNGSAGALLLAAMKEEIAELRGALDARQPVAAPSDRDAALEEAAMVCDASAKNTVEPYVAIESESLAAAIRALKSAAPVAPEQAVSDAIAHVRALIEFAYKQGFHELGYDPLAAILAKRSGRTA